MIRKRGRLLSVVAGAALACACLAFASPAWAEDSFYEQYQGQGHTKAEILAKWENAKTAAGTGSAFSADPSTTSPYMPGKLTQQTLDNGLATWNFARWLAGLEGVTLTSEANNNMAVGALVTAANGRIDHDPQQPSGMGQAMFAQGSAACRQANLAAVSPLSSHNNPSLMRDAVLTWLDDSDSANITDLTHRRWMLYPPMQSSGFGAAYSNDEAYAACQVFGLPTDASVSQEKVCWPAPGYFPIELFTPSTFSGQGQAWSVSLGSSYSRSDTSNIAVTMKEEGGDSETFSTRSLSGDKIFAVDTGGSGTDLCVIFRPQGLSPAAGKASHTSGNDNGEAGLSPAAGKAYHITVSGLRTSAGAPAPDIEYDVSFFSLSETAPPAVPVTGVALSQSIRILAVGDSFTLTPTVSPADASNKAVVWSSSNPEVASVVDGVVTARATGAATITVTTVDGGHEARCTVLATVPATYRIEASALASFGSLQTPYTRPAAQTVTVTNTGTGPVTLDQPSSAHYDIGRLSTAFLYPGATATFTVRPKAGLPVGNYNEGIAVKGSNGAAATVSARFAVTAAPFVAVAGVSLDRSSLTLPVGQSTALVATVLPANATDKGVKWASSDPSIVAVDANGIITAMKAGIVAISVVTNDGRYAAICTVTVPATQPLIPGTGSQGLQSDQGTGDEDAAGQADQGDLNAAGQGDEEAADQDGSGAGSQDADSQGSQGSDNQGNQGSSQSNVPDTGGEDTTTVWVAILVSSMLGTMLVLATAYALARHSRQQAGPLQ